MTWVTPQSTTTTKWGHAARVEKRTRHTCCWAIDLPRGAAAVLSVFAHHAFALDVGFRVPYLDQAGGLVGVQLSLS